MSADSKPKKSGFGGRLLLLAVVLLVMVVVGKALVKFAGFDNDMTLTSLKMLSLLVGYCILMRR